MPHDFVADFTPATTLDPSRACLVIVDMQHATGSRTAGLGALKSAQGRDDEVAYRYERLESLVLPNAVALLAAAREAAVPVVHVTYGSEVEDFSDLPSILRPLCTATGNRLGTPEHAILPELAPRPGEPVVNKRSTDAFATSDIEAVLRATAATQLIFCGVSTNMCVEGTLRGAADRGWSCLLAEDATGTDTQAYQDAAVAEMSRLYATIMSTAEVVGSLTRRQRSEGGTGGRTGRAAAAMVTPGTGA